ncbi:restriction endonuclease subunit M [Crocosphaera chwakensis]|uniref:Modification methylase NspV n=1 Tax=Crocosphaera chwakensis CCY0110 TaxID=391612 RepID=A3IVU7_9CHRO|nr:restriction endonuclease subunit M [Crocosphaera chwakensis]EAZ89408.1 modification methylase NspV [Crocosphaera chwakensis CCY0110]
MNKQSKTKIEYGDFQTPLILTNKIFNKLVELQVFADSIIEPTCGIGNFLKSSSYFFKDSKEIIGIEINKTYVAQLNNNFEQRLNKIRVINDNFFNINLSKIISNKNSNILILGNFPWVTNSQLGRIKSLNLPQKNNFQNHNGLEGITGKSNFDISEWMLIKSVDFLQKYQGYLAMLCKTSVARKIINYIYKQKYNLSYCSTYGIDAKRYFDASVEACLLFCQFKPEMQNYSCDIFENLDTSKYKTVTYFDNRLIRDSKNFDKIKYLYTNKPKTKWRSGVKHDCSKIMELEKIGDYFINGLGEKVELESNYIYPLIKGSNVANGNNKKRKKYILITQKYIGEDTKNIKELAPKTWDYLQSHSSYLDKRASRIYKANPQFSIFGIGEYSFYPWKIAICGLYKKLDFKLFHLIENKPVIFDDTVYFISFQEEDEAIKILDILNSPAIISFYSSLIFWDEKRPIKASILNCLDWDKIKNISELELLHPSYSKR